MSILKFVKNLEGFVKEKIIVETIVESHAEESMSLLASSKNVSIKVLP